MDWRLTGKTRFFPVFKVIYTGKTTMQTQYGELASWKKLEMQIQKL